MDIQCNTKLLLLAALIATATILTSILVPVLLHEQEKTFYRRFFTQSQHVERPITVTQGDTVYLNGSNNPCNYSSFWNYGSCELCGWNGYINSTTKTNHALRDLHVLTTQKVSDLITLHLAIQEHTRNTCMNAICHVIQVTMMNMTY